MTPMPPLPSMADIVALSEPEPNTGCWLWTGPAGLNGRGYTARRLAHRVMFEIAFGPIPRGLNVCHSCDVPQCVNPDHLFLGTQRENLRDMVRKGRHGSQRQWASGLCRKGHDITREAHVHVMASGERTCRQCLLLAEQRKRERRETQRTHTYIGRK